MQRADSLEMTLMLGKIEGNRRRKQQRMRWLGSMHMNLSKFWEIMEDRRAWSALVHGCLWLRELLRSRPCVFHHQEAKPARI